MSKRRFTALLLAGLLTCLSAIPSRAITIKEENEISREFMTYIYRNFEIVTDPDIVGYVDKVGRKILAQYPPQPFQYSFYVVKNDTYNAFAGPGGKIFIHTGLFDALESEDALAGILGHEISHAACRHLSDNADRSNKINLGTLAGIAAGIFMCIYGDPQAGTAITAGTVAGSASASLAYSREDEIQADQTGLKYIALAGYDPSGLIEALEVIRGKQWYGEDQIPAYLTTHPATSDRISYIRNWVDSHPNAIVKNKTKDKFDFEIIHVKIKAMYGNVEEAQAYFKSMLKNDQDNILGLYGMGMVFARLDKMDQSIEYLKRTLEKNAFNMGILKTLGKAYFKAGKYGNAKGVFESALSLVPGDFESNLYMARILCETGHFEQAISLLMPFSMEENGQAAAFYYLGDIYARKGMLLESYFYLGLYFQQRKDLQSALSQYERALKQAGNKEQKEKIRAKIDEIKKDDKNAKKTKASFGLSLTRDRFENTGNIANATANFELN